MKFRSGLTLVLSLMAIALSIWGVLHRQDIWDWWRLRTFTPNADIVQLADHTTMQGRGRDLFYASLPQVNDREAFNNHCKNKGEESIVLGCYTAQRIYLYNVTDTRLAGVKEVTAAHEMLHAAYERLGGDERKRLDDLLKKQMAAVSDPRIAELVNLYNKHEPGQLYNEMHSILGTEYRDLQPELEQYYTRYFVNRKQVVSYSERYEAIFSASKARITQLDAQLKAAKTQIDTNNAQLESLQQELNADSERLDSLRTSNPTAYNAAVPAYNAKVRAYNTLVASTKQAVTNYNTLVDERNQQAAAQNTLYQSLDSRYQPVGQ